MPRSLSATDLAGLLSPGQRIFVPGLASELPLIRRALEACPEAASDITFCGALVPGINSFDYASLHRSSRVEALFVSPLHAASMAAGQVDQIPLGYHAAFQHYGQTSFDLVVVHVSPPDVAGRCSLGVTTDFAEAALRGARRVMAVVNPLMPRTAGPSIAFESFDFVIEESSTLPSLAAEASADPASIRIAENVAALIRDGDCLQFGIGKLPGLILGSLGDRRRLTVHSGLVTDAVLPLLEAGSLAGPEHAGRRPVVTNALVGTSNLYERATSDEFLFANVGYTHAFDTLSHLTNFVSINSAIEVDLFGQVNSETIAGRPVSGIGGAGDFIRGANAYIGGRAIVALPSVTAKGKSRLVTRFDAGAPVSIPRSEGIIVVTENGVADLRGKSVRRRAEALIEIAADVHREELSRVFFD